MSRHLQWPSERVDYETQAERLEKERPGGRRQRDINTYRHTGGSPLDWCARHEIEADRCGCTEWLIR